MFNESLFNNKYKMYGKKGKAKPKGIFVKIIIEYNSPPRAHVNLGIQKDFARR